MPRTVGKASILWDEEPKFGKAQPQLPHIDFPAVMRQDLLVAITYLPSHDDEDEDFVLLGWRDSPRIVRGLLKAHEGFQEIMRGGEAAIDLEDQIDKLIASALVDQVCVHLSIDLTIVI